MSALKKYPIEIEAERVLGLVKQKNKPIIKALKEFDTATAKRRESSFVEKLPTLLGHLTQVSKRKTITGTNNGEKLGLNCNGVGYLGSWGTQLTTLCDNRYSEIKRIWDIMNNDDLALEISQEIVSSNRTNFLKLVNQIKKTPMPTDREFADIKIGELSVIFRGDKTPMIFSGDEEICYSLLEENNIDSLRADRTFEIKTIIDGEMILEHTDKIIKAINDTKKQVEEKTKQEAEINNFVGEMLNIFQAMEKI